MKSKSNKKFKNEISEIFHKNKYKSSKSPSKLSEFWHKAKTYAINKNLNHCPICNSIMYRYKILDFNTMQIKCKCSYTINIRRDEVM